MQANEEATRRTQLAPSVLVIGWDVLVAVYKTIGSLPAESGGAIGGREDGVEVSQYYFDESSRNSAVTYTPDDKFLNKLFKSEWNPNGIRLRGFIHSHPGRSSRPSHGDEVYAERILNAIDDLPCLHLHIVNTAPDTGEFRLTPYFAVRSAEGVRVVRGRVQVVGVPAQPTLEAHGDLALDSIQPDVAVDEIVIGRKTSRAAVQVVAVSPPSAKEESREDAAVEAHHDGRAETIDPVSVAEVKTTFDVKNTFSRVEKAYDLDVMRNGRIIAVGAGGASSWLEDLARAGLGQFVLIDPDLVSETNLATQQTYRRDIGRPKVDCIAERIRDINPTATITVIQKALDDFADDEIRRLALEPIGGIAPKRTLFAGLTDYFFAQARTSRLSLNLGLPSLCAQVYKEGRGAEVTFTYPGVTPACQRCILSSRYQHFLEHGQKNDVTSHGTPIFSTSRLNAIKGFVALAILHHGSNHPRWGGMLARIGKRNLIQSRMDPDLAQTMGLKVFDRVFEKADQDRLFFDEVVWLPQNQECRETGYAVPCPDCGGTGDLRDAIGKIADTRLAMPTRMEDTQPSMPAVDARRAAEAYKRSERTQ